MSVRMLVLVHNDPPAGCPAAAPFSDRDIASQVDDTCFAQYVDAKAGGSLRASTPPALHVRTLPARLY